jgi:hypothetical protein
MNTEILNYDAKTASADSKRVDESELVDVLTKIKKEALQGKTYLWVYDDLKLNTRVELEARVFWVEPQSSIATQREETEFTTK